MTKEFLIPFVIGVILCQTKEGKTIILPFFLNSSLVKILFSSLALFYSNRRSSRKRHVGIWNPASKKRFRIYLVYCIIGVLTLILLWTNGLHNVIAPAGFILYAILLIILSGSEKNFYLFSGIAFLLAATCFMIPAYWYSSMLILGIVYVVYGIVMK